MLTREKAAGLEQLHVPHVYCPLFEFSKYYDVWRKGKMSTTKLFYGSSLCFPLWPHPRKITNSLS